MKTTGIIRKIDELGRIVLPVELRKKMGIGQHDAIEIYVDGDKVILKKHGNECVFCGASKDLLEYKGKSVCASCIRNLSK